MYEHTYAGIGSRQTPEHILKVFTSLATYLDTEDFVLRSGGANGADSAFERGATESEIYLPWKGFNHNSSSLYPPTSQAYKMAEHYHPGWTYCSHAAKAFHARNCHQILGPDLDLPVAFVICWTTNGKIKGGTGQALRMAKSLDITVFNFGDSETAYKEYIPDIEQYVAGIQMHAIESISDAAIMDNLLNKSE